jgi:hypothetical protein
MMKVAKNNNTPANPDERSYEIRALSFLGKNGFIIPESDEEMQSFISSCESAEVELPEALKNPFDIKRRGIVEPGDLSGPESEDAKEIEENLAQAAREGGEIPDHIRERMEENRRKAESGN